MPTCARSTASTPPPGRSTSRESTKLYIDPTECIDCDACVEACPVDATMSEDDVPAQWEIFREIDRVYFEAGHEAGEKMVADYLAQKVSSP